MEPNYNKWNMLVVQKKFYSIKRWDTIVFTPEWKKSVFVKRIIWLPGETIKIKEGKIEVCNNNSCEKLEEKYINNTVSTNTDYCKINEFNLKEWYFVLWDNRNHSTDSRCCFWLQCNSKKSYEVNKKDIIGKVIHTIKNETFIKTDKNDSAKKITLKKQFQMLIEDWTDCLNSDEMNFLSKSYSSVDTIDPKISERLLTEWYTIISKKCTNK